MIRFLQFLPMIASLLLSVPIAAAGELQFRHHIFYQTLPQNDRLQGDYGLTALVDINRDGRRLHWYEFQSGGKWVRHEVGVNYQSDVGLAALDVDGDGWIDLVCSGVWFRNPGNPRNTGRWERFEFAKNAAGAHDIVESGRRPGSRQAPWATRFH